ncbi:ABC transporter permease/substrate-binding protein [Companilactobacillus metriopterae]|uniref:ABC transporter permease/substrate-binding protein n=1 Tax=Companilactobacillus metriopterae TaxID=1909267 RepID=UPI00100B9C2D|nr:ABC transporter permease/substrate-binding protein [Companilactobacillus metriopterae]
MNDLISTIVNDRSNILNALWQHLEISLIALIIAAAIAIPLAILLKDRPKSAEVALQIASIFQTIPSLALLGLLIPLVGIGTTPAVIALVVYAIMPIFQNTYMGFDGIDPALKEAGVAFGLSRRKRLFRIELPLAYPMIISGIRVALVMIIGTATLAALIGAGGLGSYIILGIQTNNNSLLIIGAGLSALLALVVSGLIRILGNIRLRNALIIIVALLAIITGSIGFNSYISSKNTEITIAGKLGPEPEILMNIYKDLILEDNPKYKVTIKPNFGATSFVFSALKSGQIDIYPEFTGTVLQNILKTNSKTDNNPKQVYEEAHDGLSKNYQMNYMKPMEFQDGYALVVNKDFAKQNNLKTISDLANLSEKARAGFDSDFAQQNDGYKGLNKDYGLDLNVNTMDSSIRYKALVEGKVDLVDGYTTDPEIKHYNLVVLKDDKKFFPPYQGSALMKDEFAKKHPEVVKSIEKISGKITDEQMQEMNYEVQVKHKKASTVAREFLKKQNLIK